MVVGDGFIATAFIDSQYKFNDKIVFASGVSNSSWKHDNKAEFEREIVLLETFRSLDKKLIYFSTSSVFDKQLEGSPYVKHKINVEKYIQERFTSYIIYRIPIVVGNSRNPNTLTNYLYDCIKSGMEMEVYENACRYLIDVEDVVRYVFATSFIDKLVVNLNFNNRLGINDIIRMFERIMGKDANTVPIDKGDCYEIDNSVFANLIDEKDMSRGSHNTYVYDAIDKYYGSADR